MAEQIALVRLNDFVAEVDSLSILAGSGVNVFVRRDGWVPKYGDADLATEVMSLIARGTSRDNLATNLQGVETKLRQVKEFIEATPEKYYVALRDQLTGETNPRQAMVTGYSVEPGEEFHRGRLLIKDTKLGLDRVPWWEATSHNSPTKTFLSVLGTPTALTSVPAGGTMPGRIARTTLASTDGLSELWLGFRTSRFGAVANFTSPWELESTTISLGTDTSKTTDATASPGGVGNTKILCTFATDATLVARAYLKLYDISNSHYDKLRGTFDLMGRMKVDSGVTSQVQLDSGLYGSSFTAATLGRLVTVSSTSWWDYNLGRFTFPPTGRLTSNADAMKNACLRLMAERTAGSGSNGLHVDCIVPIPVDEGYAHFSGMNLVFTAGGDSALFYINPLGHVVGLNVVSGDIVSYPTTKGVSLDHYHFPLGGTVYAIAAANNASPALDDAVDVTLGVFDRFKLLRGSL